MMCLPEGFTDHLSRVDALRCLGNTVVCPQAIHALEQLRERTT
jgi:hypothetical protein